MFITSLVIAATHAQSLCLSKSVAGFDQHYISMVSFLILLDGYLHRQSILDDYLHGSATLNGVFVSQQH